MTAPATAADNLLAAVLGLLRADAPAAIMGAPGAWPRWAVLLPHVLAATSHLPPVPDPGTPGSTQAPWLLDRAATYLQVHARLAEARPLQERALAITEAAHGPDHPDVAARRSNLAWILRDLGDPAAARPLQERALAIRALRGGAQVPSAEGGGA
jgi:Tetratricopeptide repeat